MIKRSGKLVACMLPLEDKPVHPLKELKAIFKQLPMLDDELDSFAEDLNLVINHQPEMQDEMSWE